MENNHPNIELRPTKSLRPYPGNARAHSKKQIKQIADSIVRFGFTNPVLISDDGQIIAGHGRVAAALLLGRETVPTLRLSHLNETERRAYVLADNKLALNAGWDHEILAIELQSLIDLADEFARAITSAKFQRAVGFDTGTVGDIGLMNAAFTKACERAIGITQQIATPTQ